MRALRNYALPLMLALLVHAGVAAALLRSWEGGAEEPRLVQPRIIQAKMLVLERPTAPTPKPRPTVPKPQPKPKPPPAAAPPKPQPALAKPLPPPPEVDRRAQEEAARQERLREMLERSTAVALADEAAALDDEEADAEAATMTYSDAIALAVIREWSRPPSARNDMQARMVVELTPAGDLLGVEIADSSGNAAFDRAAEAAVRKAARRDRFPVPPERGLFEANFRRFTLLFKPEDLLR